MSKKSYSVGEVSRLVGVESHTIRFWANELSHYIKPYIGAGNRRYFTQEDITFFQEVRNLTHTKGVRLSQIKLQGVNFSPLPSSVSQNINTTQALEVIHQIEDSIFFILQKLDESSRNTEDSKP